MVEPEEELNIDHAKEKYKNYLQELDEIEKTLKKRKQEGGIYYYVPNAKQLKFHRSPAKRVLYVGSNRSGKTTAAVAELVMHATGWYPEWYPESKRRTIAPKILWVSPQYFHIQDFVEPKIMQMIPHDKIIGKPKKIRDGALLRMDIRHASGDVTSINFQSQEQKLMAFEGSDYDIVISDEPLERAIYIAISRGLIDRGGIMLFPFTPIEQQWIKEELCDKADGKFIDLIQVDITDNMQDVNGNTILKKENIDDFAKTLSEDEKQVRLHGRWYHLSGIVFKEIDPMVHKIEDFKFDRSLPMWFVLDPHDRNPHWGIWAFVDKIDDVYICNELISTGTPEEYTNKVLEVEKALGYKVRRRIIDPNFGLKPKSVGSQVRVIDQFKSAGMRGMVTGNDDDAAGKLKIRSMLSFDKSKPIGITNKPKLYFFKIGARDTFRAMQNIQYEEWTRAQTDKKHLKEDVRDKNKHALDVVKYLLNSNPRYERQHVQGEDVDRPIY